LVKYQVQMLYWRKCQKFPDSVIQAQ